MRTLLIFALLCLASVASALTLTQAEYFIDLDPGTGNGIPVAISPGEATGFYLLQVPTTGVPLNRSHYLHTRFRSEEGPWSMPTSEPFFLFGPPPSGYQNRNITNVEYWFDNLAVTNVDIADNDFINYAALIPTSGLTQNQTHKFSVRYMDNTGKISGAEARYFFIHQNLGGTFAVYNITHIEYQYDSNPPVLVDITDGIIPTFQDSISTAGLAVNLSHKLSIRYLDERGLWSQPEARYFFIHQNTGSAYAINNITHIEYQFNSNPAVLVDVSDGTFQSWTSLIATAGLTANRSHKLTTRYLDERGLWSQPEARYFFLHQEPLGTVTIHNITHVQYWFDNLSPLLLDIADAANVNFADSIPHDLSAGPHFFRLRYRDDRGLFSQMESRPFFVWTGAGPGGNARLAGAEWFVDADPGVGSATQIVLPQDGSWDELNETVIPILVGVPLGPHLFGIRFKDELNHWSITLLDSFIMGPVLTIRFDGTNIVLDWIANPSHTPFYIYRSDLTQGPFVQIGSTNNLTYTDVGATLNSPMKFYHIRTTLGALSNSHPPPEAPR